MSGKYVDNQSKPKKPFYKRWWFWVIVAVILLGGCFGSTSGTEDTPKETTAPETTAATTEATTEAATSDINTVATMLENIVKETFKNYDVSTNDKMIIISVWDDGIALGSTLAANGDAESKAGWDAMVESQVSFSKSAQNLVETAGLDDVTVLVNVLNDLDNTKTLLSVADGTVIYNAVE